MNPFFSGTRLSDMIRAIRACKTAAEERGVVRKECATIRASISENDIEDRPRNLAKLMFIHMLGYPTHFGQMECLKLIASPGFPEKRIGYLGLMLLLDERHEVLMLVTNSIKQDLNHHNQYIVGLALCSLGNICSAEMARDLAPEVERLLQFRDPNIRKKAALCSIRILKKVPDLAEIFINPAAALLKEKHHGVLITGVQLCTDLCKISTEALQFFRQKCTDGLVRVLKDVVNSSYTLEYDVSGITDPFLHIRLLKALRVLGNGDADSSDCMNDILAQVATKTESKKNAGNAILYECVGTIMGIEDNSGLRVLAINILGRFLSNRDNNIRYVALNMLMRGISVDSQAVQRHRATILECVKDSDPSIRKRALELVYVLANESNVETLAKELIDYLEVSDSEFREDLSAKICSMVEKFSPNKIWYIDQMVKVLSEGGKYVKDEVWHALIVVITNASNLHGYTVRLLYRTIQTAAQQDTLVRVGVWCIGEYGDMLVNNTGMLDIEDSINVSESDTVNIVEVAIKCHNLDLNTKAMCLIALLKLSTRFPSCSQRINDIINEYKGSFVLELQQRAIEFDSIIKKHQNIRSVLVERMPVLDEVMYSGKRGGVSLQGNTFNISNGVSKSATSSSSSPSMLVDLLDLTSSSNDAPPPPNTSSGGGGGGFLEDLLGSSSNLGTIEQTQKNGTDVLMDLLSIGTPPHNEENKTEINTSQVSSSSSSSSMMDLLDGFASQTPPSIQDAKSYPSVDVFESSSLKVTFNFSKQPENVQAIFIEACFTNKSFNVYSDFVFQAAVPKYLQLHLDPASSNTVPANGTMTQKLRLTNTQYGKKSVVMRVRISYKVDGKEVLEEGQINNFPRGL